MAIFVDDTLDKSTRSSLMSFVAAFTAVSGFDALSASRIMTGRPSTPSFLLNRSTATLVPWTSWIDDVLYGLDKGSMIPILIGAPATTVLSPSRSKLGSEEKAIAATCRSAELIPGVALLDRPEHRFFELL